MRWLLFALLLGATLAGCVSNERGGRDDSEMSNAVRFSDRQPAGVLVRGPGTASQALTGFQNGTEPSIGFASDGTAFLVSGELTLRSNDLAGPWEVVLDYADRANALHPATYTEDPMLVVDPVTNRIHTNHLYFRPSTSCTVLLWSDDLGSTWTQNDLACSVPKTDHQKLAVGPPGPDTQTRAGSYPTILYLCYNQNLNTYNALLPSDAYIYAPQTVCTASHDGGSTFLPQQVVASRRLGIGACGGLNGRPAVGPDGTAAVAIALSCPYIHVAITRDSGMSWATRVSPFVPARDMAAMDPDLAFGDDGTMYLTYVGEDFRSYLGLSRDGGETWQGPWVVSPPDVLSTTFPVVVAGAEGRVAVAMLGTQDWNLTPSEAPNGTRWHLWIVASDDAVQLGPEFMAYQVTSEADPVQIGCIWLRGGQNPCRNLRDFMDADQSPAGRVAVSFTDGCTVACANRTDATNLDSRSEDSAVAWLDGWLLH